MRAESSPFEIAQNHHRAQGVLELHDPLGEKPMQLESLVHLVEGGVPILPDFLVRLFSAGASAIVAAAGVDQVAHHLRQPWTRLPRRVGRTAVGREKRLLSHVLALVACKVARQSAQPRGVAQQILDPDVAIAPHPPGYYPPPGDLLAVGPGAAPGSR
jgi:hypothetical protein